MPPTGLAQHCTELLNCHDRERAKSSIVPAEGRGGKVATAALLAAGQRRIAFTSDEPWMEVFGLRKDGYERALRAARNPVDPSLLMEGNFSSAAVAMPC